MGLYSGKNLVALNATLRDVMDSLDKSARGVVFVLDEEGLMRGLLTDGDVRRALLNGCLMDTLARKVMNSNFISGTASKPKNENGALLSEKIRNLPVLDDKGRLVDAIYWTDFCFLPVMEPTLKGNEAKYVADCLANNWISSKGRYVEEFQNRFQDYLAVDHALAVSNGTVALHLAMAVLGIGAGDEVIIPDLTFISPASMALQCGAKPIFADVNMKTWTLGPASIEALVTPKTKAIVPVHLYGHPCDMDPIMEIARRHNLHVIEDCAEALGTEYKGRKVGTIGDIGTFSFFANKVITTGEGGMVTTSDAKLYEKMSILRDHGMSKGKKYWHDYAGFNYRLTNMQAAVGLAQMEQIDSFLNHRERVVNTYKACLEGLEGVTLPVQETWARNIYWIYSILIDDEKTRVDRDMLMTKLAERGIETRPLFPPLHNQPPFGGQKDQVFPNTSWLADHGVSLPTSNYISLENVKRVCSAIREILN